MQRTAMENELWDFDGEFLLEHEGDFAAPGSARLQRESAFGYTQPGFVSGTGTKADAQDNEFIFWNYAVGSDEPRPQHNAVLARVGPRWRRALAQDPALRIKIIGSASLSSGDAQRNRSLGLARARRIARILVNVFSIPAGRIDVESVGDGLSLADELNPDDPMNMARDRRVELFLHAPARLVRSIPDVSVQFASLSTNLDGGPNLRWSDESDAQVFAERSSGLTATGRATWSGPRDALIGFLQFVTLDVRRGLYRSLRTGRTLTLDYGRCSGPFLPCFDGNDSAQPLSLSGQRGTGRFERVVVPFMDRPGFALPREVVDPIAGRSRLVRVTWDMNFALIFGVRLREQFQPLRHVLWSASSMRLSPSGLRVPGLSATLMSRGAGAPPGLNLARAMSGASCRLRTRSMDMCSSNLDPRGCPPRVCTAAVTRM